MAFGDRRTKRATPAGVFFGSSMLLGAICGALALAAEESGGGILSAIAGVLICGTLLLRPLGSIDMGIPRAFALALIVLGAACYMTVVLLGFDKLAAAGPVAVYGAVILPLAFGAGYALLAKAGEAESAGPGRRHRQRTEPRTGMADRVSPSVFVRVDESAGAASPRRSSRGGTGDSKAIGPRLRDDKIATSPDQLLPALYECWSSKTSSQWRPEIPAQGQGHVTALVVQDCFGGEILKTKVPGGWHFYNLVDGVRYDLTLSQFTAPLEYCDVASSRGDAFAGTGSEQYAALRTAIQNWRTDRELRAV